MFALKLIPFLMLPALLATACIFPTQTDNLTEELPHVRLTRAFKELSFDRPIHLCHDGVHRNLLYVAGQDGRIHRFENRDDVKKSSVFLDISSRVFSYEREGGNNEEGLLGLAFHPKFAENGHFFVNYSTGNALHRRTSLSRFTISKEDSSVADPRSEVVLWDFEKPFGNHNGGALVFGPDGYLYVGYGDGGDAGDPGNRAQNLALPFGKILRIDVNATDKDTYGIPADNPFVGRVGAKPEIFAYGFRNPWRMSFDGDMLWVGDVGEKTWESVHIVTKGSNHGWSLFEGSHWFKAGAPVDPVTPPVAEYDHDLGACIIGGYVYRGRRQPALNGMYIYADFTKGRMWGLSYTKNKVEHVGEIMRTMQPFTIIAFGVDADNELFACGFDGKIYRVEAEASGGAGSAGGG